MSEDEDEVEQVGLDLHRHTVVGLDHTGAGSVSVRHRGAVTLIEGSFALTLDEQPVVWFENWIRARIRTHVNDNVLHVEHVRGAIGFNWYDDAGAYPIVNVKSYHWIE